MPRSATGSLPISPRSAGRSPASSPRPLPAATAIPNSSSGRVVTERLVIGHIGQRGDGVADTPAGAAYVSYALPGETVEVEPWPGHPDRRHFVNVVIASPERTA